MLISQGAFCRAADCTGAEVEAKRIAAQVEAEAPKGLSYQAGDSSQLDHLVNLAKHTPGIDAVQTSSDVTRYDNISYLNPYLATVDGHPTLALANVWRESPAEDSESIGYAVAFWQEAGDKLVSVAGFHFRAEHSGIKSVWVTR